MSAAAGGSAATSRSAHTAADSVVHVPDAGVLFGGDILFIGCTPIVWAGPIANWIAACDAMIALDARRWYPATVRSPTRTESVLSAAYLEHVSEQAEAAYRKGLSFVEAVDTIDLGEYATWLDAERVVVNIYQRSANSIPTLRCRRCTDCWGCRPSGWRAALSDSFQKLRSAAGHVSRMCHRSLWTSWPNNEMPDS